MTEKKVIKILSIDGGGFRGIIPCLILKEIEKRLIQENKESEFYKLFDLIAGASTGGLIALGLSMPDDKEGNIDISRIDKLIKLYETKGSKIFPGNGTGVLKRLKQFLMVKYSVKGLEEVLTKYFNKHELKDAKTNIIIPGYATSHSKSIFFKKRKRKKGDEDFNFLMKDVARAGCAAPTYFPAAKIKTFDENPIEFTVIDGGVFVNNPEMCAYIEARKIFGNDCEIKIISIGNGIWKTDYKYKSIKKWGFLGWINPLNDIPLMSVITDGQNSSANHYLNKLPGVKLLRVNTEILYSEPGLDNVKTSNINGLKKDVEYWISHNDKMLKEIVDLF